MTRELHIYRVYRVLNISTKEAKLVGSVIATSFDDARKHACNTNMIKDFQTFRVEREETAT
jgi:hypothetical protein